MRTTVRPLTRPWMKSSKAPGNASKSIGVKLRHMFDEVVNEPVPDEFLEILRRADQASSTKEGQ